MMRFYRSFRAGQRARPEQITLSSGIEIAVSNSKVVIDMPFPSPDSVFYRHDGEQLQLSNDLRLLHETGDDLHSTGILSLLLMSTTVPPLTPFEDISALRPGFRYEVDLQDFDVHSEPSTEWSSLRPEDNRLGKQEQLAAVSDALDTTIQNLCGSHSPIVLFSGGVDSSVMALRLSDMGVNDARLFHCSFGESDPETEVARAISSALGMPLDVYTWDGESGYESLTDAASVYWVPFCDHSTVPTYATCRSLASRYGDRQIVLDGTGADGAFGYFKKARAVRMIYRIPRPLRRGIGAPYHTFGLWKSSVAPGRYCRILRQSALLPPLIFAVSRNAIINIGYRAEDEDIQQLGAHCEDWISAVSGDGDYEQMIPLSDLALEGATQAALKVKAPLNDRGLRIGYPFLEQSVIDVGIRHSRFWPGRKTLKPCLKRMLVGSVPSHLVYRKGSGWVAPPLQLFSHPIVLEHIRMVTERGAPLKPFVKDHAVNELVELASKRARLPGQTYNFLWGIAFVNTWLSQVDDVSSRLRNNIVEDATSGQPRDNEPRQSST